MSTPKIDILWSPNHEDKFLTFDTDLCLYKVEDKPIESVAGKQALQISDDKCASLLTRTNDNQFIKCLAWYPKNTYEHLIATGLANGKILLSSFTKGQDPDGIIGKEFVPRHPRQCNALAWNADGHLLAQGLDRYKQDASLLIWDVTAKYMTEFHGDKRSVYNQDAAFTKPRFELATTEATFSIDWFNTGQQMFAAGINHKVIRIYDLRDTTRNPRTAHTKAVYGVNVDPHNASRLVSYFEGQVSIWDMRNFDKPLLTLSNSKPVVKVAWSPTRQGLLGVLHADSPVVRLYDIQNTTDGSDEIEPAVIERIVQPHKNHQLSSFDWHHMNENRLLAVTHGGIIRDAQVLERIALDWSPDLSMSWACGRNHEIYILNQSSDRDISMKMQYRAQNSYGLQREDLMKNCRFLDKDETHLHNVWQWMDHCLNLRVQDDILNSPPAATKGHLRFPGVKNLLLDSDGALVTPSELQNVLFQGLESSQSRAQKQWYFSDERQQCIQLCGWGCTRDAFSLTSIISRLLREKQYEKAAAIAIFNLQLKRSIEALQYGSKEEGLSSNLGVVAMALSGFTDEKQALWREMCRSQRQKLQNAYLKAIFTFLTADDDQYEDLLNDNGIDISDRVAFACLYLNDNKLSEFIKSITLLLIKEGNLDGIVLTGLGLEGLELLEQFVDQTSDVQSASLILLQGLPNPELARDPRVEMWIESYRLLLDKWKLWHQRAEFDVFKTKCEIARRPLQQVFVSCNFCGKPVAQALLMSRSRHFMYGGTTPHKPKTSSCPACRKPLPRCAICLINLGTAAGTGKLKFNQNDETKLSNFSDWFTWCQTCRHGGHANHITDWFRSHSECPVTGCSCHCSRLDALPKSKSDDGLKTRSNSTLLNNMVTQA